MGYYKDKKAEEETIKFFRKKYGLFWKRKINPEKLDWIMVDKYYNKFKEFSNSGNNEGGKNE